LGKAFHFANDKKCNDKILLNYSFTGVKMGKRITKEDIFQAAFSLERDGKDVTSTRIREELGSGSLSTITKYLKMWVSEKNINEKKFPDIREVLNSVEEEVLIEYFSNELNQVMALVFSYLKPKKAASVLKKFPKDKRDDVLKKMETMEFVQARTVGNIAKVLALEFRAVNSARGEQVGGKKFVNSIRQELEV